MKSLPASSAARRQGGVVLIFAMVALVVLLIGAVAMVRSMSTALFTAGNYGFKRDLVNQSERVMQERVIPLFNANALSTAAARQADLTASNYSASTLPSNAQGIPTVLLGNDAAFTATFGAGDITPANNRGVRIRYVIDRFCAAAGPVTTTGCLLGVEGEAGGINSQDLANSTASGIAVRGRQTANPIKPLYRVSIRVDGPRRTQGYFQTTFTMG
jgi:type IV pilus assembly protein PilX